MLHTEAKRVNFDSGDDTGFEMTVSGIKPESLHRFEVRARCATLGLDAPDWRKKRGRRNGGAALGGACAVAAPAHAEAATADAHAGAGADPGRPLPALPHRAL